MSNDATSAMNAQTALDRLRAGNEAYRGAQANTGDISASRIEQLFKEGQFPYACIVTCADSRVVPEHIFMCGLGELFCIRVAGNVIGTMELASCVYAAEHLHTPLIVLLGHTQCGAIGSTLEAIQGDAPADDHALAPLVKAISKAIGDERDPHTASIANVQAGLAILESDPEIQNLKATSGLSVIGAIYHTDSGKVEFL